MYDSFERHNEYSHAMDELRFSEETKARITKNLLNPVQQPLPHRTYRPLRTALIAAAACIAFVVTAAAAAPTIWEVLQTRQGPFAPVALDINGAVCADQGIEVQILSALSDDVRGWVYYTVRDTTGNRLDEQLFLDGELTVSQALPLDTSAGIASRVFSNPSLEASQLVSYDPDTKTALFAHRIWFGNGFEPVQDAQLSVVGITTQTGHLGKDQENIVSCHSVTSETLQSLPAADTDEVLLSPGDVAGAPYGNEILPEEQVVLAPGQNPAPIVGNQDIQVSSMGIASDGCFHVRLECGEGVEMPDCVFVYASPKNPEDATEAHSLCLVRRVENGQDILFPMLHAAEVEQLEEISFYGAAYTRPGTTLKGSWSMDFRFAYHTSKVLHWTGELSGLTVSRLTISPLSVTMDSRGPWTINQAELCAELTDGTVITAKPSTSSFSNHNATQKDGPDDWESYNTWEFEEPVDPENVAALILLDNRIPVEFVS